MGLRVFLMAFDDIFKLNAVMVFGSVLLPRSLHKGLEMAGDCFYKPEPGLARTPGHVGSEQQVRYVH